VSSLFPRPPFVDFGPFALLAEPHHPTLHRLQGKRPAHLRAGIREQCPRQPGVYGMVDLHGELVYVGKAKNLRARLLSYFRPRSRDSKAGSIVAQARWIVWEPGPDEFAALHRELELIRRWRPRCNVQGQPRSWQHTYVCLGRPPAPYAFLAQRPAGKCVAKFGPLPSGRKAQEALRRLNDLFQLRDCPRAQEMLFAEEADLFPMERTPGCIRHDLGTCLGPCAGICSQADYSAQVRAARAFLAGRDLTALVRLQQAMEQAAAQQEFERAALLRDKLAPLQWLTRQLERVRRAEAMDTVIYPVEGHDALIRWYLLFAGRAVAALHAPGRRPLPSSCPETASKLAQLAKVRSRAGRPGDWLAGVMLMAAWFRKHPSEEQALLPLKNSRSRPRTFCGSSCS
jgi:excinuclease ABC subunit C